MKLIDSHGRRMRKLRVSLTEACNFRCIYCMPPDAKFRPNRSQLSTDELVNICKNLNLLGIEEIRLTGGEPTLRHDFLEMISALSELPLKKLAITTNGHNLNKYLDKIDPVKCSHINFSIDSLSPEKFAFITNSGKDSLAKVLDSCFRAQEKGMKVKINTVLMRGINDNEINNFVEFSANNNIEVRFLEVMNIGVVRKQFDKLFISASDVIQRLKQFYNLGPIANAPDSTSFNYKLNNGGQIGFISSQSKPFCSSCSRIRLNASGVLRPCLMVNQGLDLKNIDFNNYPKLLNKLLKLKPESRIYDLDQPMYQVGG